MSSSRRHWGVVALAVALVLPAVGIAEDDFFGAVDEPEEATATVAAAPAIELGRSVYVRHCATCHGVTGRGDGPAGRFLDPQPRDFTTGDYKFRTTPTGSLPSDDDILRTIDDGAPGSSMPGWKRILPSSMRRALVPYLKTFSKRFAQESVLPAVPIPLARAVTPNDVADGRRIYLRLECNKCHGDDGSGDGRGAADMKDSIGRPIGPNELIRGVFRAGDSHEALYRTLITGFNGTPMPAYDQTTKAAERWPLVFYLRSLRRNRGWLNYLFAPLEERKR